MARFVKNKEELNEAVGAVVSKVESMTAEAEDMIENKKPVIEQAVKEAADKAVKSAGRTARKTADSVKKTVKKFEPKKTSVVFEANGRSFDYDEIVKKVNKACKGQTAKKLEIYVNAAEETAYYVLDGTADPSYKVEL